MKDKERSKINTVSKNMAEIVPKPTQPNLVMAQQRAKYLAELFAKTAKTYTGDVDLPTNVISSVAKELRKAKVTINELMQLDERPYAVIPHDLATRSHWFMRRFRNSGGWNLL